MAYAIAEMLRRHEPAHQEVVSLHDELDALMNEGAWERLAASGARTVDCMATRSFDWRVGMDTPS